MTACQANLVIQENQDYLVCQVKPLRVFLVLQELRVFQVLKGKMAYQDHLEFRAWMESPVHLVNQDRLAKAGRQVCKVHQDFQELKETEE